MTKGIISDITGKTVAVNQSYLVKVKNQSTGLWIEFDTERNDELMNQIALALQNGCKWYSWHKEGSELTKVYEEEKNAE
jgi:hypothetical protein